MGDADDRLSLEDATVRQLLRKQFPELADLPLMRIAPGGWDNLSFRLGTQYVVRLPSAARYAHQIDREVRAFDQLAAHLCWAIPSRFGTGVADNQFPYRWAINRWIDGAPPAHATQSRPEFAHQCGRFLASLHALPGRAAPPPAPANFHRGAGLATYHQEMCTALSRIGDPALRQDLAAIWQSALACPWQGEPVWVHGDFFPWNVLVDQAGSLTGVIDWGLVAGGDPACDMALAWSCLDRPARRVFRAARSPDPDTWLRAQAWSLWKALTLHTGVNHGPPEDIADSARVLEEIRLDYPPA